jgi:hypothetical protein
VVPPAAAFTGAVDAPGVAAAGSARPSADCTPTVSFCSADRNFEASHRKM